MRAGSPAPPLPREHGPAPTPPRPCREGTAPPHPALAGSRTPLRSSSTAPPLPALARSPPPPPYDPHPPSQPTDEVMPEPSRGWGTWIQRQRVCVVGRERVAKGGERLQLLLNWGAGADAFL